MRVCLVCEGSYPIAVGGVAEWTHRLIRRLPEVEFVLWTVTPTGREEAKYDLPPNVVAWKRVSLEGEPPPELPAVGDRIEVWNEITRFHLEMLDHRMSRFARVQELVSGPRRRLNLHHLVRDEQSWRLLSFFHQSNDAVHPFSEYYWGWYATHVPMLKLLEEPVPQADVYHATCTGYAGFLASLAKLRTGRPMLLTEHGIYVREREIEIYSGETVKGYQKQMWSNLFRSLARICYDQADLIISLSERNRNHQLSLGAAPEKTRVIPNGIEVENFHGLRQADRIPVPQIGLVGRVVPVKDVRTFIMAARILKNRFPTARFWVVGPTDEDPVYFERCRDLVNQLELADCLDFLGRQDVRTVYPSLDLLMLTSLKEEQPLVLIEAMCAGIPVVATDVGDVRDLLAPEWPVVPPKDPEALAKAASEVLSNPEQSRRLAEQARQRALQRYNIHKLIEEYGSLYRRLAAA
ncbi:MAG: GT4 family glycosyltransferase PelF [candidate division KSB1 bacterium]|nr:GT4 family glycosyltransferase PelF [candidate division KSB1 bacterium]